MKNVVRFIIGILLVVVVQSCSQKDSIESSLNLTAPSGELISENTISLKKEISAAIALKHGIDGDDFQITKIDYVPLKTGYSATITYKYDNDKEDVIIKAYNVRFTYTAQSIVIPDDKGRSAGNRSILISCKSEKCSCKPVVTLGVDSELHYTCEGCDDCSLIISSPDNK